MTLLKGRLPIGLPNAIFTRHGERIEAATSQFAETRDISAINLAGGWKSQASAKQNICTGCAIVAAVDIPPEAQARIPTAAKKFAKRMTRYIANHSLILVANATTKCKS